MRKLIEENIFLIRNFHANYGCDISLGLDDEECQKMINRLPRAVAF